MKNEINGKYKQKTSVEVGEKKRPSQGKDGEGKGGKYTVDGPG